MKLATVEDFTGDLNPLMLAETRDREMDRLARILPPRYREAEVTVPEIASWVRGLISDAAASRLTRVERGASLLLLGATGTGKTYQAYGVLRALAQSGAHCDWWLITAPNLFASLRPRPGVDLEQLYDSYATVPLLVLDDLGAEKQSEWTEEYLCRLVNSRWEWELPTLVTSNVTTDQFSARFGQRVTSRLVGMCTQVKLTGTDRRRTDR